MLNLLSSLNTFFNLLNFLIPLFLLLLLLVWLDSKSKNNDYNEDSPALKWYKRFELKYVYPIKSWFKSLVAFLKEYSLYVIVFLIVWAFNFNLFAIAFEILAYCFYFFASFDFINLYMQVYKLCCDLMPLFTLPLWL